PQDENATAKAAAAPQPSAGVVLGVTVGDLTAAARDRYEIPDNIQGVLITGVTPGGPAYNAGIIGPGLVITDVNRVAVTNAAGLRAQLQKLPPGDDVLLRLYNGGPQAGATYFVIHPAPAGGR